MGRAASGEGLKMEPATRFGPYEIIRRLGKSMNDVYLAQDTRENRRAALKLIKCSPDAVSRLVLEAERRGAAIQQRLRTLDPRMIEIYDYGDRDGYFYVAMQYVEGRSLSEALERDGRMEPYRGARIAMEICGQLEKFHSFQPGDGTTTTIVHGDIKPSNIHLGPNETVRLLDFGIAKTLRPDCDFTFHNFGSPSYCSPERLGRSLVDQQADLWAVGVTLYEMVAGAPPYQAENTRKLERLIQSRRPPRALPSNCPRALKAIIGKALAPDAERRYTSAAAFHSDLKAFVEGAETAAEQEKRSSWRPNPTLESGRAAERKRKRTDWNRRLRLVPRTALRAGGAMACVLTGMLVFMGTSYFSRYWTASRELRANLDYAHRGLADINADWALFKILQRQFAFLGGQSPVARLRDPLRMAYTQAGAQALEGYVRSSDSDPRHFDWQRAELCLMRAQELGASGTDTLGRLALARGYAGLATIMDSKGSDSAALFKLRENARDRFAEAARDMPQSPDPHLGLARIYIYSLPSLDNALAEFQNAVRLGYRLGPREIEQQADAYRLRGIDELHDGDTEAARQHFDAARGLYATIPGYHWADYYLRQIPDIPAPARHTRTRHKPRPRKWR
jgi:serine/threonine protein kinase